MTGRLKNEAPQGNGQRLGNEMIKGKTSGIKSSEFLVTILGLILGALAAIFSDSELVKIGGPIVAVFLGASYNHSRGMVKRALAGAEAVQSMGKSQDQ